MDALARTHEVENQSAPLVDVDLLALNRPLRDALALHAPGFDASRLSALGRLAGSAAMQRHARLANLHKPVLHTHDRWGRRIDEVEFHPSYHVLMQAACEAGLHGTPWAAGTAHAHLERAAGFMLFTELEPSVLCPVSMTYAVTPALRPNTELFAQWGPKLAARAYDPTEQPAADKAGLTMGMGMTEKQGGSDVRANATRAVFDGDDVRGSRWSINGHKWFFSAPMSDAHLVLAQTDAGPSCFAVPRVLDDGARNRIVVQRLKDKLGNHANASAEVEFDDALGWLVGTEGRGVQQILQMGVMTRLDCSLGTAGLMRHALSLAIHHARQRQAFGRRLVQHALMANVLADLALESEAATALALRVAASLDADATDTHESELRRLLTPAAKFWICKRGAAYAQEAMECLGGNGYVEESGEGVMARIYREMPVNSIWEGAGNIMGLDLLRALRKGDGPRDALRAEFDAARGGHPAFDRHADALLLRIDDGIDEAGARRLSRDVALAAQASLLLRHAPSFVSDAFCGSRLAGDGAPAAFGLLPPDAPFDALIDRALPS